MKNSRRDFVKKTGALAGLSAAAGLSSFIPVKQSETDQNKNKKGYAYVPDAGIKLCFSYFRGLEAERRKVEFGRQLNVLGAVI